MDLGSLKLIKSFHQPPIWGLGWGRSEFMTKELNKRLRKSISKARDVFRRQPDMKSCGLYATKMVLSFFGMKLREDEKWDTKETEGTSVKKITSVLSNHGLTAIPKSITYDSLSAPSIAWYPKADHYVVIMAVLDDRIFLNDPLKVSAKWEKRHIFEKKWLKEDKGWVLEVSR